MTVRAIGNRASTSPLRRRRSIRARHHCAVARLSPLAGKDGRSYRGPTLMWARAVYGDRVIAPSGSEVVVAAAVIGDDLR